VKDYLDREYSVPDNLVDRFEYINYKIDRAKEHGHDELFMAYNVVLTDEFKQYKIKSTKRWFNLLLRKRNEHV